MYDNFLNRATKHHSQINGYHFCFIFRRFSSQIPVCRSVILIEVVHGVPQFLHKITLKDVKLCNDYFVPNPF
jgi:hypothetical protein